jgi:hypothetical protein
MADGNEDLRADDLPGPAFESYEAMELACPAERSGHVAVSDGRHMFVWGGYKVSGVRAVGCRLAGPGLASGPAAQGCPRVMPVGSFSGHVKAPRLLSRQPQAYEARSPHPHLGATGALFWGRPR